jgi:sortase A
MTIHMVNANLLQRPAMRSRAVLPKFIQDMTREIESETAVSSPHFPEADTDSFPMVMKDDRLIHSYRTKTNKKPRIAWRWVFDKWLMGVEIGAVVGFVVLLFTFGQAVITINKEAESFQRQTVAQIEGEGEMPAFSQPQTPNQPSTAPTLNQPALDTIVSPALNQTWTDNNPLDLNKAYDHSEPITPPIPTGSGVNDVAPVVFPFVLDEPKNAGSAQRLQIPALGIDKPIFQGDDEANLKLGVGQYGSSAQPGEVGNMVLAAHNDIYGQIFRHLDKLLPGDEIIISTSEQVYTYVVREIQQVDPTETWVLSPTDNATATLISCYPYLINNKRIVVFADLVKDNA